MDLVADARDRARGRLVVAFFHRPRCPLTRTFETEVLGDADVRAWLAAEAVFIEADAERTPELIDRYALEDLPTTLVLGRTGAELARLSAFDGVDEVLRVLRAAAQGKDMLTEAFEAVERRGESAFEFTRLAQLLSDRGRFDEALTALRRAVDARAQASCPNCVGLRYYAESVARLGEKHPPARAYLVELRERAEERLLLGVGANEDDAADFVALCSALRDWKRVHEVYEGADGGPARRLLGKHAERLRLMEVFEVERRWDDPVDAADLGRQVARHLLPGAPGSADRYGGYMERVRLRAAAGALLDRLFAAGKESEARAVCELVIGMDGPGFFVWTNLIRHAERGGAAALAADLRARAAKALPLLPLRERASVRKALEGRA